MMRRTTVSLALVLLAVALAAPPARAQGRCKAGEEEDPQTGKCRPVSSSEEGSGKRRGSGSSKTTEIEEEVQLKRESCELRCRQNHVNCRDDASKCDQTHTLCMDLCWKEYLANLPAASRRRVLKAIADAEKKKADDAEKAKQVARAEAELGKVQSVVAQTQSRALTACQAAKRLTMPELPCDVPAGQKILEAASKVVEDARKAKDAKAASKIADKVPPFTKQAEKVQADVEKAIAPTMSALATEEARLATERAAEEARRLEEEHKRQAAEAARLAAEEAARQAEAQRQAEIEAKRVAAEQERQRQEGLRLEREEERKKLKEKRQAGWLTIFVGGGVTLGVGGLFFLLERAMYSSIEEGGHATLEDLESQHTGAQVFNAVGLVMLGGAAVCTLVGGIKVLANRDPGPYEVQPVPAVASRSLRVVPAVSSDSFGVVLEGDLW